MYLNWLTDRKKLNEKRNLEPDPITNDKQKVGTNIKINNSGEMGELSVSGIYE